MPSSHDLTAASDAKALDLGRAVLWADRSWLQSLPPELVRRALRRTLAARVMNRLLLQRLDLHERLDEVPLTNFRWTASDPERIRAAARRLGGEALAPLVRTGIRRDLVHAIRTGLGEAAYQAIMAGAELAVEPLPRHEWQSCTDAESFRDLARATGVALILAQAGGADTTSGKVLRLLFPVECLAPLRQVPGALDPAALARRLDVLCGVEQPT